MSDLIISEIDFKTDFSPLKYISEVKQNVTEYLDEIVKPLPGNPKSHEMDREEDWY